MAISFCDSDKKSNLKSTNQTVQAEISTEECNQRHDPQVFVDVSDEEKLLLNIGTVTLWTTTKEVSSAISDCTDGCVFIKFNVVHENKTESSSPQRSESDPVTSTNSLEPSEQHKSDPVASTNSLEPSEQHKSDPVTSKNSLEPSEQHKSDPVTSKNSLDPSEQHKSDPVTSKNALDPSEQHKSDPVTSKNALEPLEQHKSDPVTSKNSLEPSEQHKSKIKQKKTIKRNNKKSPGSSESESSSSCEASSTSTLESSDSEEARRKKETKQTRKPSQQNLKQSSMLKVPTRVYIPKLPEEIIQKAFVSVTEAEKAISLQEKMWKMRIKESGGKFRKRQNIGDISESSDDELPYSAEEIKNFWTSDAKDYLNQPLPMKDVTSDSESSDSTVAEKRVTRRSAKVSTNNQRKSKRKISSSDDVSSESLTSSSCDSDEVLPQTKKKWKSKTRKRVKVYSSDSSQGNQKDKKAKGKQPKVVNGRKNIKKVLSEKELKQATKDAIAAEKERAQRIAEKQKLYNETFKACPLNSNQTQRLILEMNVKTKEAIVEVHERLCKELKPHQVEGVKFLYHRLIESTEILDTSPGSGGILAHSMGLGKTLQMITFIHTIFTNALTKKHIRTCLIICPVNTLKNWINEFTVWLNHNGLLDFMLFDISEAKTNQERVKVFREWRQKKGVMVIGNEMFTSIVLGGGRQKKMSQKALAELQEALLDSDLVVLDEGHLIKNEKTAFNQACNNVKTLRRVILTGTPLQNSLNEYHTMVSFVVPNLLGTKKEFENRFENPIMNGQCLDSSPSDVKLMKKRVHVLYKLLSSCVHRLSYDVLKPYLQPKYEYVINVQLTMKQIELYENFLRSEVTMNKHALLADSNVLRLIWNHPTLLQRSYVKKRLNENDDFITSSSDDSETDDKMENKKAKSGNETGEDSKDSNEAEEVSKTWHTRSRGAVATDPKGEKKIEELDATAKAWFRPFLNPDDPLSIEISGKMILFFAILDKCEKIGDKVLVFSQSVVLLDLIEEFLEVKDAEKAKDSKLSSRWIKGRDYFRIDGSTDSSRRKTQIDHFNKPDNLRARLFLVSTKAGSLGINLIGANRCILFDAHWNPTWDLQAIFRIYRFGQTKPVYVYRFLAQGTMEEKIYERQVVKQSLSCRVIDEQQINRHFRQADLAELYAFKPDTRKDRPTLPLPKDRLLADVINEYREWFVSYHEHDSLLENRPDEDLTEEERLAAWAEYELEKENEFKEPEPPQFGPAGTFTQQRPPQQQQQQWPPPQQQQWPPPQQQQRPTPQQQQRPTPQQQERANFTRPRLKLTIEQEEGIYRSNLLKRKMFHISRPFTTEHIYKLLTTGLQTPGNMTKPDGEPSFDLMTAEEIVGYVRKKYPHITNAQTLIEMARNCLSCQMIINEVMMKVIQEKVLRTRRKITDLETELFNELQVGLKTLTMRVIEIQGVVVKLTRPSAALYFGKPMEFAINEPD